MTSKQERRLVRTRQPKTGYAGPGQDAPVGWDMPRRSRRVELTKALQEWAEDYQGIHSVFED